MRNAPEEENARTHTHTRHNAKFSLLKTRISFLFFSFFPPFFFTPSSFIFFVPWILRGGKEKGDKKIHEGKKNRKNFLSLLHTIIIDHHLIADNALLFERVGASFGGGLRDDEDGERERDINSN